MTHVNFLVHRLLVSETQTDRQTIQICNRYMYMYIYIYIYILYTLFSLDLVKLLGFISRDNQYKRMTTPPLDHKWLVNEVNICLIISQIKFNLYCMCCRKLRCIFLVYLYYEVCAGRQFH